MHHLPGYAGTSSVLAVTLLHHLQQQQQQQQQGQGQEEAEQQRPDLRLVGTLAHEVRLAGTGGGYCMYCMQHLAAACHSNHTHWHLLAWRSHMAAKPA